MKDKMRVGVTLYEDVYPSLFDLLTKISSPRQRAARLIALADLGLRMDLRYVDSNLPRSTAVELAEDLETVPAVPNSSIDNGAVMDLAEAVKGIFG